MMSEPRRPSHTTWIRQHWEGLILVGAWVYLLAHVVYAIQRGLWR